MRLLALFGLHTFFPTQVLLSHHQMLPKGGARSLCPRLSLSLSLSACGARGASAAPRAAAAVRACNAVWISDWVSLGKKRKSARARCACVCWNAAAAQKVMVCVCVRTTRTTQKLHKRTLERNTRRSIIKQKGLVVIGDQTERAHSACVCVCARVLRVF